MKAIKKINLKAKGKRLQPDGILDWLEVDEVEVRVEFDKGHLELTVKK